MTRLKVNAAAVSLARDLVHDLDRDRVLARLVLQHLSNAAAIDFTRGLEQDLRRACDFACWIARDLTSVHPLTR
jgi:hypothetical protein